MSLDSYSLAIVLLGAAIAGFTTGFAGFGTGLVASGLWFHVLPAPFVPPLVALAAVAAHLMSLFAVRKAFDWPRALPFLLGGIVGLPIGIAALAAVSPTFLKATIGAFLIVYSLYQLVAWEFRKIGEWGGRVVDGLIGIAGGFLGGFAGLSGPVPLVWLQLRGGDGAKQRAIYQPFNLIILAIACIGMRISGQMSTTVIQIAALCLPVTLLGAWTGAHVYIGVSPQTFQRVILCLLIVSGGLLVAQSITW